MAGTVLTAYLKAWALKIFNNNLLLLKVENYKINFTFI